MVPTVVYTHGGGRLGNQLVRFAHWLAWAEEHSGQVRLVNLAFWPYARAFATWRHHPGCAFPLRGGWPDMFAQMRGLLPARVLHHGEWRAQRWAARVAAGLPGVGAVVAPEGGSGVDLEDPAFTAGVRRHRFTACSGWRVASWSLLEKHEIMVRALFAPEPAAAKRAELRAAVWRNGCDLLVGVFMRGTDYREWAAGRYCFPISRYAAWMREVTERAIPRRVRFVVTSDEPRTELEFAGLSWVFSSGSANAGGDWMDSFLDLANCDHIMAPPSTFAACAAWLGRGSLWALRSPEQTLDGTQQLEHPLFDAWRDTAFGEAVN